MLRNGDFEADWGEEKSHRCLIFPVGGEAYEKDVGNIFTPPGWVTWFRHQPGVWDQPEVRDAWKQNDPRRVHGGEKAILLFTFFRKHDAGFLQQIQVQPGTELRLTTFAHAWSNHNLSGHGGCNDAPRCSCGVGQEKAMILAGDAPELNGEPWNDAVPNFTFALGIDPTGGTDPFADTVVWGQGAHIYNEHCPVPAVRAVAQASTVTVFLRSTTMWAFKHNDAYWDDALLEIVGEPQQPEEPETPQEPPVSEGQFGGGPREQYERTYVLMPPEAGAEWVNAVINATWDEHRHTIGGSADDAGIGDLDVRRVIAVNPQEWGDDLRAFFGEHYPEVEYVEQRADSPAQLEAALGGVEIGLPEPIIPRFTSRGVHDRAGADWLKKEGLTGWCLLPAYLGTAPQHLYLQGYVDAGIRVLVNLRYSYATDDGGMGTMPIPAKLAAFERACVETMSQNLQAWGFVYGNEMNNPREYPAGFDLTPDYYLQSYNRVWAQRPLGTRLLIGAIDPYNAGWGDWRVAWRGVLDGIADCDGLALHAYTHDSDLARIRSGMQFSDAPLTGVYYDLRVLESLQAIVPERFADRLQVVTETNHWKRRDGKVGWNADAGRWVTEAYRYFMEHQVDGVCLFRFNHTDWRFGDLPDVLNALKAVL